MRYYEVWVSSLKYHRDTPLTYSYNDALKPRTLIAVPLQQQTVAAVVIEEVKKPHFKVKSILRTISHTQLPAQIPRLIEWMKDYYPAPMGQLMTLAIPSGLASKGRALDGNDKLLTHTAKTLPALTPEQSRAISYINKAAPKPILLHGNTGTGKTRVYLERAKQALASGKSVLLLTPEIGLTPQLVQASEEVFPGHTTVLHSDLTPSQRRTAWRRILEASDPQVVIGPRSALFAPINNLGLVVLDEFHETSYKQEQTPYYLASRVAGTLAKLHGAQLLLGSATPPVTDYHTFQQKKLPIVRMQEPALTPTRQHVAVIDLKQRHSFTKSPWMANSLIDAISAALEQGEQSMLFLNRRGTSRMVLCQSCGWQALCPRCDVSLTYHNDTHILCCHICGYRQKTPTNCLKCSANDIIFRVIGTKFLEGELNRLFPRVKIGRFDSDIKKADRLERQYSQIKKGEVDILIGTQMLGKGLDLPRLSVLGVVLADTSLSFPDYTAEERTFQLLTQVTGRVNRGHTPGKIYIQTHNPSNLLLKAVLNKDYDAFYKQQLAERQKYHFPPFRFVLKLTCSYAAQASAKKTAQSLIDSLKGKPGIELTGPSPAFVEKRHGRYHWQVIVRSTERAKLLNVVKTLSPKWTHDIDPIHLL